MINKKNKWQFLFRKTEKIIRKFIEKFKTKQKPHNISEFSDSKKNSIIEEEDYQSSNNRISLFGRAAENNERERILIKFNEPAAENNNYDNNEPFITRSRKEDDKILDFFNQFMQETGLKTGQMMKGLIFFFLND